MNKRDELLALVQNDTFGLLKTNTKKRELSANESALVSSFEEILHFIDEYGREPQSNISDINEYKLFSRLRAIKSDANKLKLLKKYDLIGLLNGEDIKEITLENIISDDSFGLLQTDVDTDIYNLKHVKPIDRIQPDYLARRTLCKDFSQYKEMFSSLHEELALKKRRLVKYRYSDLEVGKFYVLSGLLLYLKSTDGMIESYSYNSGERARFDGRTLCIFDNGTQSDMLFRSLDKAMQIDGYSISDKCILPDNGNSIIEDDVFNGYIYVLKSKNPNVQHIQDLYKIGHTTGSVAERIKNAKLEATYLFDNVEVVSTFRCFNIHSYNLEQTIHDFFSSVKLDIELWDKNKNVYRPKEWFRTKLQVVEDAIKLIISGGISDHVYDDRIQQIIRK